MTVAVSKFIVYRTIFCGQPKKCCTQLGKGIIFKNFFWKWFLFNDDTTINLLDKNQSFIYLLFVDIKIKYYSAVRIIWLLKSRNVLLRWPDLCRSSQPQDWPPRLPAGNCPQPDIKAVWWIQNDLMRMLPGAVARKREQCPHCPAMVL